MTILMRKPISYLEQLKQQQKRPLPRQLELEEGEELPLLRVELRREERLVVDNHS